MERAESSGVVRQSRQGGSRRKALGVEYQAAAFDRATGKILGKLGMPFAGLGRNGAMGGCPFFRSPTLIETQIRLH